MKPVSISGSTHERVMTAHQLSFSGLAADDGPQAAAFFSLANGGHAINNDNSVFKINLMRDAPVWERLTQASARVGGTFIDLATGKRFDDNVNPDGSPVSAHSYYTSHVIRKKNIAVRYSCKATHPNAVNRDATAVFDLTTGQWRPCGIQITGGVNPPGAMPVKFYDGANSSVDTACKHPITERIYVANAQERQYYEPEKNIWVNLGKGPQLWGFSGSLIDVKRNRWVFASYPNNRPLFILTKNLSTLEEGGGPVPAGPTYAEAAAYGAVVHDTDNDLYWYLRRSEDGSAGWLYSIHPDTLAITQRPEQPTPGAGPCNRFFFFPALHGIAYVPARGDMVFIATR